MRVVDLKTGASKPTLDEVRRHGQLGAYQLAVEEGAFAEHGDRSGGAALLQLGRAAAAKSTTLQLQPPLDADDEPRWARDLVEEVADGDGRRGLRGHPRLAVRHLPGQGLLPRLRGGEAAVSGDHAASGLLVPDGPPAVRWGAVELARALGQAHAPTPEQVAVIEAPLRPLLVVAGAGSGKTETMAARVVWLVANDLVRPDEVLGLTFTRKAAGELSERLSARLATLREAGLWTPRDEARRRRARRRAHGVDLPRVCRAHRARARRAARGRGREPAAQRGGGLAGRARGRRRRGTARWTGSRRPSRP